MDEVTITLRISSKSIGRLKAGRYSYELSCRGQTVEGSGEEKDTTGHRLVMACLVAALRRMRKPSQITVRTDSGYLAGCHGKLAQWADDGWMKSGKEIPNKDLWEEILTLTKIHAVRFALDQGVGLCNVEKSGAQA